MLASLLIGFLQDLSVVYMYLLQVEFASEVCEGAGDAVAPATSTRAPTKLLPKELPHLFFDAV